MWRWGGRDGIVLQVATNLGVFGRGIGGVDLSGSCVGFLAGLGDRWRKVLLRDLVKKPNAFKSGVF
jgi:hypothetical protein